jgi:hypothetical protein
MTRLGAAWEAVQEWLLHGYNAPLVLVLLLLSWLLMLNRRRDDADARVQRRRPEPLTLDELGRLAFLAARSRDDHLWRDLFVHGAEARALLGDRAQGFLETRTPEVLKGVLDVVATALPQGATYAGIETDPTGVHALKALTDDGTVTRLSIGRSVQVGVHFRLLGGDPGE